MERSRLFIEIAKLCQLILLVSAVWRMSFDMSPMIIRINEIHGSNYVAFGILSNSIIVAYLALLHNYYGLIFKNSYLQYNNS